METLQIEIINPKAKNLLKNLADLKLISIKTNKSKTKFADLLDELKTKSNKPISLDEITKEVEEVRKARYAKK